MPSLYWAHPAQTPDRALRGFGLVRVLAAGCLGVKTRSLGQTDCFPAWQRSFEMKKLFFIGIALLLGTAFSVTAQSQQDAGKTNGGLL
jgi:hypothetical protein